MGKKLTSSFKVTSINTSKRKLTLIVPSLLRRAILGKRRGKHGTDRNVFNRFLSILVWLISIIILIAIVWAVLRFHRKE